MRRYNITHDAKTTAGGKVVATSPGATIDGKLVAREGDTVICPACGTRRIIVCVGPHLHQTWMGRQTALEGDLCRCECEPPPQLIANQSIMCQEFAQEQPSNPAPRMAPQATPLPPANFSVPAATSRPISLCVFAKSCVSVPTGSTAAGTAPERATHFGATALLASTGTAGTVGRVAGTLGSELGTWAVRGLAGASAAVNVVLLAFMPRDIGDSTLYTPEQLAGMQSASTRVRFQFRQDENGEVQVYGIHTRPDSGADRVSVTRARWNAEKSAMVAVLDGISITWTPNNGPVVSAPSPYPGVAERLDNLLVHPIAPGQDTGITHYPGRNAEDITWQDTIITFPADSGVAPLYLVFAKPAVRPLEVDIYAAFSGRPRNGLHVDHMPSQAALEQYLVQNYPHLAEADRKQAIKSAASVAIPARIHQKYSETFGWRNSKPKQQMDADNLQRAVDRNFDAIKPYLLEEGFVESDLEEARTTLHKINKEKGWY